MNYYWSNIDCAVTVCSLFFFTHAGDFRGLDFSIVDNELIAECVNCIDDSVFGKKTIYMKEVCRLVNVERMARGLQPLVLDEYLCRKACSRASEINKKFSHTRPNYEKFYTILNKELVGDIVGENIAIGWPSPERVVWGWMHSRGHRKNILCEDFTIMGVGFNPTENSWVQLFSDDVIKNFIEIDKGIDYAGRNTPDSVLGRNAEKIRLACDILNQYRTSKGLEPLELDPILCKAANTRAHEIGILFSSVRPPKGSGKKKVLRSFDTAVKKKYHYSLIAESIDIDKFNAYDAMHEIVVSSQLLTSSAFGKIGIGYDRRTGAWVEMYVNADAGLSD